MSRSTNSLLNRRTVRAISLFVAGQPSCFGPTQFQCPSGSLKGQISLNLMPSCGSTPVSYTHLDVYKRQAQPQMSRLPYSPQRPERKRTGRRLLHLYHRGGLCKWYTHGTFLLTGPPPWRPIDSPYPAPGPSGSGSGPGSGVHVFSPMHIIFSIVS